MNIMEEQPEILNYDIKHLTPAMVEIAEKELGETNEVKLQTLRELKSLIKNEKDLITTMDDVYLLRFLRFRKFDVNKTFKALKNYSIFKLKHENLMQNVEVQKLKEMFLTNILVLLPYRDLNGCIVCIARFGKLDVKKYTYEDVFQSANIFLHLTIQYPATQVCGYRAIFDYTGFTWSHLKLFTPWNLKHFFELTQNCFPGRYKGVHIVSKNKFINGILSITYPWTPPKLKERIFLHGSDVKPLKQFIHPSVLPREYGGEVDDVDNKYIWNSGVEADIKNLLQLLT